MWVNIYIDFLDKGLYDLCITADEEDGGYDNEVGVGHSKSRMALGRVLVWLMAPAAAEQLKYGWVSFPFFDVSFYTVDCDDFIISFLRR